jgi:hypothetical protein
MPTSAPTWEDTQEEQPRFEDTLAAPAWDDTRPLDNLAADVAKRIPEGMATGTGRAVQGVARGIDTAKTVGAGVIDEARQQREQQLRNAESQYTEWARQRTAGAFRGQPEESLDRIARTFEGNIRRLQGEQAQRPPVSDQLDRTQQERMSESTLYQMGTQITDDAREFYNTDRARDREFIPQAATALGEMAPTIVAGAVTGPAGAAVQYGASAGESAAQEAEAMGRPEQADLAFLAGAGLGAITEGAMGVPGRLLSMVRRARAAGIDPSRMRQTLRVLAEGAAREGAQEGLEQTGGNAAAAQLYDPNRPLMQDVPRSVALGAALGGVFGGGAALLNRNASTEPPRFEDTAPDSQPQPELPPDSAFRAPAPEVTGEQVTGDKLPTNENPTTPQQPGTPANPPGPDLSASAPDRAPLEAALPGVTAAVDSGTPAPNSQLSTPQPSTARRPRRPSTRRDASQPYDLIDAARDSGGLGGPDLRSALDAMKQGRTAQQVVAAFNQGGEYDALIPVLEDIREAQRRGSRKEFAELAKAYSLAFGGNRRTVDTALQGIQSLAESGNAPVGGVPADPSALVDAAFATALNRVRGRKQTLTKQEQREAAELARMEAEATQQDPENEPFAPAQGSAQPVAAVQAAVRRALGVETMPGRIEIVNLPGAPWAGVYQDGRVKLNAATIGDNVERVLFEEGMHGIWADPQVQAAWQAIRDEVTPQDIDRERARRQGLDTRPHVLREEAAIAKVLSTEPTGAVARLLNAIRDAFRRLLGITIPGDAKAQLLAAARQFLLTRNDSLPGKRLVTGNAIVTAPGMQVYRNAVTAHHGTPHKVDKFTTAKIGTGEGAQVYGWGLYFAENPEVANEYQKNLSAGKIEVDGKPAAKLTQTEQTAVGMIDDTSYAGALQYAEQTRAEYPKDSGSWLHWTQVRDAIKSFEGKAIKRVEGNKYTVRLNVEPEQLLDWDKPLSEQSEKVRAALSGIDSNAVRPAYGSGFADITGGSIYARLLNASNEKTSREASQLLASIGIRGIRYLDQGSRVQGANVYVAKWSPDGTKAQVFTRLGNVFAGEFATFREADKWIAEHAPEPTYNYVIFDENDIEITHENGQPVSFGKATQGEERFAAPEERTRKLAARIEANPDVSADVKERIVETFYQVANMQGARAAASQLIAEQGLDAVKQAATNMGNGLPGAIRGELWAAVARELAAQERAANSESGRLSAVQESADWLNTILPLGTDAGQLINALKAFNHLTPEGAVAFAQRTLRDAGDKVLASYRTFLNSARSVLAAAHQQARTDTLATPAVDAAAVDALIEAVTNAPEVKAAITQQAAQEAVSAASSQLSTLTSQPGTDAGAVLETILGHYAPGAEPGTLTEKLVALGVAQDKALNFVTWLDRKMAELAELQRRKIPAKVRSQKAESGGRKTEGKTQPNSPSPITDSQLDAAIKRKLRELKQKLADAVKNPQAGRELGDAIVKDSGLTGNAAERLRKAINDRFNRLATERKRKALEKIFKQQPNTRLKRKYQSAIDRILVWHNLGAFEEGTFNAQIAEKMGLRQLTAEDAAEIRRLANAVQAIPEDQVRRRNQAIAQLQRKLANLKGASWWDLPMAYWFANVLSGPATQMVNVLGNSAQLVSNTAALTARGRASGDVVRGLRLGLERGLTDAVQILREGKTEGSFGREIYGGNRLENLQGWEKLLTPLRYVGRAMSAADAVFYYANEDLRAHLLAREAGKREGLSGQGLRKFVANIMADTDAARSNAAAQATEEGYQGLAHKQRVGEILEQARPQWLQEGAVDFAQRTVYRENPYGVLGWLHGMISTGTRAFPPLKFAFPFITLTTNFFNESFNWLPPVSGVRLLIASRGGKLYGRKLDLSNTADVELYRDHQAKLAIGTVLMGALAAAAEAALDDEDGFAVFGKGPLDAASRKTWIENGGRSYSVRIGGKYFPYQYWPQAAPLAVLGNYYDTRRWGTQDEQATIADKTIIGLQRGALAFLDVPTLQGIAGLLNTLEKPGTVGAADNYARRAARTAGGFVPGSAFLRFLDNLNDSTRYDGPGMRGAVLANVPFAHTLGPEQSGLRPVLNGLGEPVQIGWAERFVKDTAPDPVWRELARLDIGLMPQRLTLAGTALTDEELYQVVQKSGPVIRREIDRALKLPEYRAAAPVQQRDALRRVISRAHDQAKRQVIGPKYEAGEWKPTPKTFTPVFR